MRLIKSDELPMGETWQQLQKDINNERVKLCKKLEKEGRREVEHQLSNEVIIQEIKANEYEYLSSGKLWSHSE